jgi:hypothetical protein
MERSMAKESSPTHAQFHYSVQCHTEDEMVLACLRALCHVAEENPKPNIGWGGTGVPEWKANGRVVTFRFTSTTYRERFVREASRLLEGRWREVARSDADPARRQRPL